MININNKQWDKLRFSDIQKLLDGADDETFFFEFKSDDESPEKLIKEISALANTYGGYILLGINDDKSVGGCTKWTEQRIHTTIHDSITPTPVFDVKKFRPKGKNVFVLKIEEGNMPPYITNKGHIFERISSGSFPIKDSAKLSQLFYKREEQLKRIKNKIELEDIDVSISGVPNNICGYLDMGFSMNLSAPTKLQKEFYKFDLAPVTKCIRDFSKEFSISRLGYSYLISIGNISATADNGERKYLNAGINNFIELLCDGSIKCRIILTIDPQTMCSDISLIGYFVYIFKSLYSVVFKEELPQNFISAHKYEKLTVLKQFTPIYKLTSSSAETDIRVFQGYLGKHKNKYGNNLMIESNRVPKNDYIVVDKRYIQESYKKYTSDAIIDELFALGHNNLGYIDPIEDPQANQ